MEQGLDARPIKVSVGERPKLTVTRHEETESAQRAKMQDKEAGQHERERETYESVQCRVTHTVGGEDEAKDEHTCKRCQQETRGVISLRLGRKSQPSVLCEGRWTKRED